ncbi:MAG TPA: ERF family protein [Pirellulales bacterium]
MNSPTTFTAPRPKNPDVIPGGQYESLYAAKLAVMERVPYLQKDTAKGLTYSFASESGLIEKLHPAMRETGLTWGPVAVQLLEASDYQTRHGVVMFRVRVLVVYRLTHAASGTFEEYHALGEASDNGDKGCAKAMTIAQKYALRQAFLIETGDDPDRTPSEEADPHEWQKRKAAATASREPQPTPEQREAAAVEAILLAEEDGRLNKLELSVIERTGSDYTPSQASRLIELVGSQRKTNALAERLKVAPDRAKLEAVGKEIAAARDANQLHKGQYARLVKLYKSREQTLADEQAAQQAPAGKGGARVG